MAIVKTTFDSGSSNLSQVAAWLQANATDYFDDISFSGTAITCTKDGHNAFVMANSNTTKYNMYISNGIGTKNIKFRIFNKPSINFYRIKKK